MALIDFDERYHDYTTRRPNRDLGRNELENFIASHGGQAEKEAKAMASQLTKNGVDTTWSLTCIGPEDYVTASGDKIGVMTGRAICKTTARIDELIKEQQTAAAEKTAAGKAMEKGDPKWTAVAVVEDTDKPSYDAVIKLAQQIEGDMEKLQCPDEAAAFAHLVGNPTEPIPAAIATKLAPGNDIDRWILRGVRACVDAQTDALIVEGVTDKSGIKAVEEILSATIGTDPQTTLTKLTEYMKCADISKSRYRYHLPKSLMAWKHLHNVAIKKYGATPAHTFASIMAFLSGDHFQALRVAIESKFDAAADPKKAVQEIIQYMDRKATQYSAVDARRQELDEAQKKTPTTDGARREQNPARRSRNTTRPSRENGRPCKYFPLGTCWDGDKCRFRHEADKKPEYTPRAAIGPYPPPRRNPAAAQLSIASAAVTGQPADMSAEAALRQEIQQLREEAAAKEATIGHMQGKITQLRTRRKLNFDSQESSRQSCSGKTAPTHRDEYDAMLLKVPTPQHCPEVYLDSLATEHVVSGRDKVSCTNVQHLDEPKHVQSWNGLITTLKQRADMTVGGEKLQRMMLSNTAPRSLGSIPVLNDEGKTVVMGPQVGGLIQPDGSVTELVPKRLGGRRVYMLPTSTRQSPRAVLEVLAAYRKVKAQQIWRQHAEAIRHKRRIHQPKDPDCPDEACHMGKFQKHRSYRTGPDTKPSQKTAGIQISFDIEGPYDEDINQNIYKLVAVEANTNEGAVVLMKNKLAISVLPALQQVVQQFRYGKGDDNEITIQPVARLHSDEDKSFLSVVGKWIDKNNWRQGTTTTGGYDSNANQTAEGKIRKLADAMRAALMSATGNRDTYPELWGPASVHTCRVSNDLPEAGALSPNERKGLTPVDFDKTYHIMGCKVLFFTKTKKRKARSKPSPRAKVGIYVGNDPEVPGAILVIPIHWDVQTHRYIFDDIEKGVKGAKIYENEMPLTRVPRQGGSVTDFAQFVKYDDDDAVQTEVYAVDRIVDARGTGRTREYKVKWENWPTSRATWVPSKDLTKYGAQDMVDEYEHRTTAVVAAHVALDKADAEDEKAARYVLLKYKRTVTKDWTEADAINAYLKERAGMLPTLRKLEGEEKKTILKSKNFTWMRMNPENKGDGRKKFRWLVMGNMEPKSWNEGGTDSPVMAPSSAKMIIFAAEPTELQRHITIGVADIDLAYTKSDNYGPNEQPHFVAFRPYKGADIEIHEQLTSGYGQRNAGRRWFHTFRPWAETQGLEAGHNDPCIFHDSRKILHSDMITWLQQQNFVTIKGAEDTYENHKTGVKLKLATYKSKFGIHVDDVIAKGVKARLQQFFAAMDKRFGIKPPQYCSEQTPVNFLGQRIQMGWNGDQKWYSVDMQQHISKYAATQGIDEKPETPIETPIPIRKEIAEDRRLLTESKTAQFKSRLMSIMYMAVQNRYGALHAASRLAANMATPNVGDDKDLQHLEKYMIHNNSDKIQAIVRSTDSFELYVDSDHAGDRKKGKQSRTSIFFFFNGVPVYWASKKQPVTAISSAEAEIYALMEAVKAARLLLWKAEELGIAVPKPITIYMDNAAGISFQKSTCNNTKLGGTFDLRQARLRELKDMNLIETVHVKSEYNPADLLTKIHPAGTFKRLMALIKAKSEI